MNAVGTENFFWGEEYYTGLVKFKCSIYNRLLLNIL